MRLQKISGLQDVKTLEILLKNEHFFEALVASSTDGITVQDSEGNIMFRNRSAELITGYRTEDLIGLKSFELMHPDDREAEFAAYKKFTKKPGKVFNRRYRIKHKSGRYIWMDLTLRNWLDKSGLHGIVTTFRDVTKEVEFSKYRDELEEQLRISNNIIELVPKIENTFHFLNSVYSYLGRTKSILRCTLLNINDKQFQVIESTDIKPCVETISNVIETEAHSKSNHQIYHNEDRIYLTLAAEEGGTKYMIVAEFAVNGGVELTASLIRKIGLTFSMALNHIQMTMQFKQATKLLLEHSKK